MRQHQIADLFAATELVVVFGAVLDGDERVLGGLVQARVLAAGLRLAPLSALGLLEVDHSQIDLDRVAALGPTLLVPGLLLCVCDPLERVIVILVEPLVVSVSGSGQACGQLIGLRWRAFLGTRAERERFLVPVLARLRLLGCL